MRTQDTHIIQKVFVEVNTNTSAKAYDIQLNSHAFLQHHVFTLVESYIARLEAKTKDWAIQLDKIELNLDLTESVLGEIEFKESVEKQLDLIFQPILNDLVRNNVSTTSGVSAQPLGMNRDRDVADDLEQIAVLSPLQRHQKSVLHFIETGHMPWWVASHEEMRQFLKTERLKELLDDADLWFINALTALMRNPIIRRRLIRQFPVEFIAGLVTIIVRERKSIVQKLVELCVTKEFVAIIQSATPTEKMELIDAILISAVETKNAVAVENRWRFIQDHPQSTQMKTVIQILEKNLPEFVQSVSNRAKEDASKRVDNSSEEMDSVNEVIPSENTYDKRIVENAGLVILSPFFKSFLTKLDLLEDGGSLKDPVLTAHILHFLATGEEEDFEFALIFEAFLCGLPLDEPLPKSVPLSDAIKSECNGLLAAVLTHWDALKSRSIPLLQKNYLQRQGKLMLNEETPRIIVERSGVDILLDKIPWSISVLKLPWHDKITFVEW